MMVKMMMINKNKHEITLIYMYKIDWQNKKYFFCSEKNLADTAARCANRAVLAFPVISFTGKCKDGSLGTPNKAAGAT